MSLANIFNQLQNQFQVNSIDAGNIELHDVPISGGGGGSVGTLSQVLNTGSDGNNQSITNLNSINMNGYLNLNSASLGQFHFNNGTNSWQILTSSGSILFQNYLNNNLVSSSFQIDGSGDVYLGSGSNPTPMVYVYGNRGESRVYDTLYNPIPSNPSGSNAVIYNQNYIIPTINATSAIVNNNILSNNFVVLKNLTTNNYGDSSHYVLNINSIVCTLSNFEASNFYLDFALISNRNGVLTTITQSDLNKNFTIPRFLQSSYTDDAEFTISDIQIEFYDNSGINNMMLVCFSNGLSVLNGFYISSINMNVRADNIGVYNDLANITS
jgi:hypothetical protein